jgi:hypothetical protein
MPNMLNGGTLPSIQVAVTDFRSNVLTGISANAGFTVRRCLRVLPSASRLLEATVLMSASRHDT